MVLARDFWTIPGKMSQSNLANYESLH